MNVSLSHCAPPGARVHRPAPAAPSRPAAEAEAPEPRWDNPVRGLLLGATTAFAVFTPAVASAQPAPALVQEQEPQPERESPIQELRDLRESVDRLGLEGRVGPYTYDLDLIDADLDLNPRASLSDGFQVGLEIETEAEVLRSRFSRTIERPNGWTVEQGLRGGLFLKHEFELNSGGENDEESRADLRGEMFREWRGRMGEDMQVQFGASLGMAQDFIRSDTVGYLRLEQKWEGGGFEWRDRHFTWTGEGRQEFRQSLADQGSTYDYRLFGGVRYDFERNLLGRDLTFETRFGPEIRGNERDSFHVGPKLKVRVRY